MASTAAEIEQWRHGGQDRRRLAALGGILALRVSRRTAAAIWMSSASSRDRAKHFAAVSECNSEIFKVLIGQVGQD